MNVNLLLDTTREVLMLAVSDTETGEIVHAFHDSEPSHRYHSAILLPRIQAALAETGLSQQDITGVGVNLGPGSFTGIRTGLTVARLMGQYGGAKTYGFNTFQLVAGHSAYRNQPVTLFLNAFRQQHYRASLQVSDDGNVLWLTDPAVCDNTATPPVTTPLCFMEASLEGKFQPDHPYCRILREDFPFTPQVMAFFLQSVSQNHLCNWTELRPMYMQLPHITLSKTR